MTPYELARADIGTKEIVGPVHNDHVVRYFHDVGHEWVRDDETAWCAAFVGAMLMRGGLPHTGALNARSYLDWGTPVALEDAQEGDVVIFWRVDRDGWQGHVGFLVRLSNGNVIVVGGNQSNEVNEGRYSTDRILGVRRMAGLAPGTPGRTSRAQSTTLQATGLGSAGTIMSTVAIVPQLDGDVQMFAILAAVVVIAAFAWISRERLKRWAKGDR